MRLRNLRLRLRHIRNLFHFEWSLPLDGDD